MGTDAKTVPENCWNEYRTTRGALVAQCKWCGQKPHAKDCPIPALTASEAKVEAYQVAMRQLTKGDRHLVVMDVEEQLAALAAAGKVKHG
jgi:hypothetical protein